jgi:hypothetical protein
MEGFYLDETMCTPFPTHVCLTLFLENKKNKIIHCMGCFIHQINALLVMCGNQETTKCNLH